MYLSHWNLREAPFQNVSDPHFAYLADQHQESLAKLIYAVRGRKLAAAVVGPYGVGKSMLLEMLARNELIADCTQFQAFDAPPGGAAGMARQVQSALGLMTPFVDEGDTLARLREATASARSGFRHTTLAIDEAHLITPEALAFLHRLTNFTLSGGEAQPRGPAFTLILAGHMRLERLLLRDQALRQRVSLICRLERLTPHQTVEYVSNRIRAAGGDIWVFEPEVLEEVAAASGGIPRVINTLCDIALMLGFSMGSPRITRDILLAAIAETASGKGGEPAEEASAEEGPS